MRVITLNVNGIRSAAKKGLFSWLAAQRADVVCLQEVKAQEHDLDAGLHVPKGYTPFYALAEKKGYSGVALYTRRAPDAVIRGFGTHEFDSEGRYLEARFGKLSVISIYLPSGSSGAHRQASKFRFLDAFMPQLKKLARARRDVILCGDWNIAHKEIDLRNWRSNQKNSGFLPEERAWLSRVFDEVGLVDVFRRHHPDGGVFSWWDYRGGSFHKGQGMRIDLVYANAALAGQVKDAWVDREARKGKGPSDHAPVIVDLAP